MEGKLKAQKFREVAFAIDRNVRLPVADKTKHSTLQWTKHPSDFRTAYEHLFLICDEKHQSEISATGELLKILSEHNYMRH